MRSIPRSTFLALILLAVSLPHISRCKRDEAPSPPPTATAATATTRTIAYIVPTLNNPFFVDMTQAAATNVSGSRDFKIAIQAPPQFTNVEQQIALIENAVAQRVAVICLVAADSKGVIPALLKAQSANIPVLLVDNTIDPTEAARVNLNIAGHIGSDNRLGGRLAGEFIVKMLKAGGGEVAMLEGVLTSDVADARKQGFLDGIRNHTNVKLVASQTANYDREQGLNVFQNILRAHPSLDAVFAANDEMALGAIQAISETGLSRPMIIVGFDATNDAVRAIDAGLMSATVQQQPKEMGRIAAGFAMKLAQGQSIPSKTLVPVQLVTRK